MTPTKEEEFTAKETAAILGCSRTYLYQLMQKGRLHKIQKPTIVRQPPMFFQREEVLALAAEIHGHPLTDDDVERLRREAQGAPGGE